jgi:hypothetical protein
VACDVWISGRQENGELRRDCLRWIDSDPPGAPESPYGQHLPPPAFVDVGSDVDWSRNRRLGFRRVTGEIVHWGRTSTDDATERTDYYLRPDAQWRVSTGDPAPYLFAEALRAHFVPDLRLGADWDAELFESIMAEHGLADAIRSAPVPSLNKVLSQAAGTATRAYRRQASDDLRRMRAKRQAAHDASVARILQLGNDRNALVLEDLDLLGFRANQVLRNAGIVTVGDLTARTRDEIRSISSLGDKAIAEIDAILRDLNLSLRHES